MNLVFFCGSFEEGKDGVGDYVRRIAEVMLADGHRVAVVALSDPFVAETRQYDAMESEINILRFPMNTSWQEKVAVAKPWIKTFKADWLSLQYVHFAYHIKGLPFGLENHLKKMGGNARWHIMFHELWLGIPAEASLKHRLWGLLQRFLIMNTIKKLQPSVMHTQCQLYRAQLEKAKIRIKFLPLFSNVPVFSRPVVSAGNDSLTIAVFGSIHPMATNHSFAHELAAFQQEAKRKVNIVVVGRAGALHDSFVETFSNAGIAVTSLGAQPVEKISEVLSSADFGLATAAPITIDKNGTVVAMLDHGLPVICIGHKLTVKGMGPIPVPDGVLIYEPGNAAQLLQEKKKSRTGKNDVHNIVNTFITDLNSITN